MAKILHIEEDSANRLLVRQILEELSHNVVEAGDGLEGINTAQEEKPDLILIDLNISGMDGYETATRIKSFPLLKKTPIIALTTGPVAGDRERALTAGCDGYIIKPVDIEAFPRQIAEFLAGRREKIALDQESVYLREYNERIVDHLEQKVRELTEANKELEYRATMKARFIDLAAHELRTPLAAVHGYLSILTAPSSKFLANTDEDTLEIIDGIVVGVDRLRGLVQDMLDVSRIRAGTLQISHSPVNLKAIFQVIHKDFGNVVKRRKQELVIGNTDQVPTIWADGERITQILRNLVSNAVKYTPDGGTIELSAQVISHNDDPSPSHTARTHHFVKITVRDSGVGIAPDQQEHIFEHFYEVREIEHHSTSKTDFMGGGAGLGLPIARGVAEAHGGSLWVESDGYGQAEYPGSKFHLILPFGDPLQDQNSAL